MGMPEGTSNIVVEVLIQQPRVEKGLVFRQLHIFSISNNTPCTSLILSRGT